MESIIKVRGVSKRYRVGQGKSYGSLRESLATKFRASLRLLDLWNRSNGSVAESHFWALRDVEFDVQPGEILGIIGSNGAGKSTLLKILSRITRPTAGHVELYGRVGSLLEVGTGFHPELTGRDNIFLNGAILGMKRAEIASKFDEIVDFSGVERFIDAPVKRYSSGMYVRLAFAVAAHLQPEILLVDEVLAVGDAAFQKKCLGKMDDVSKHGRTVVFVSHNMAAVQRLCWRGILLDSGRLVQTGSAAAVVAAYHHQQSSEAALSWERRELPRSDPPCFFSRIWLTDDRDVPLNIVRTGGSCCVNMEFQIKTRCPGLEVSVNLLDWTGDQIFGSGPRDAGASSPEEVGAYHLRMFLPVELLLPRRYLIRANLWHPLSGSFDQVEALSFTPEETASRLSRPGVVAVRCNWSRVGGAQA